MKLSESGCDSLRPDTVGVPKGSVLKSQSPAGALPNFIVSPQCDVKPFPI